MDHRFVITRKIELTWSFSGAETDVAPIDNQIIDISQAETVVVQVDSTSASNTSGSFDLNIYSSPDGFSWDSVQWQSFDSIGDNIVKTFTVSLGPKFIKATLDNNQSADIYVKARFLIREKP